MQQGLLFHSLLVPRSGTHIGQVNLLFRGGLDLGAFEAAWRQVISRISPRTGFVAAGSSPCSSFTRRPRSP